MPDLHGTLREIRHLDELARADSFVHRLDPAIKLLTTLVFTAADDDVGVGVAGVEMIDSNPVELGVEVALHLGEQVADEGFQVRKLGSLISGDDKPKLMRVLLRPVEKGVNVHSVGCWSVATAGRAIAGDAITNDVPHVRPRRAEIAGDDARIARLDDDPPAPGCDETGGGAQACSHAALRRCWRDVAALPQHASAVLPGLPEHQRGVALGALASSVANASELSVVLKLVIGVSP